MKFLFHRLWSWAAWLVFLLISPQPVNKSSSEMQLKINYAPISLGKLRIWSSVHHSLKSMKDLGMNKITGAIWMIILQNFLLAATDISVTYKFLMEIQLLWEILWWTCYEKKILSDKTDFCRQHFLLKREDVCYKIVYNYFKYWQHCSVGAKKPYVSG